MAEDQTADNELGPETIEFQLALALATLTVAFVQTLRELQLQDRTEDALIILREKLQLANVQLLRSQVGAERAEAISRFVFDALRNPAVIDQPDD